MQKNTNLLEKDEPTLGKCQNFGKKEYKCEVIYDILHVQVKINEQHDSGEQCDTLQCSNEGECPRPLSAFFTAEEDAVHQVVNKSLTKEVKHEDAAVDGNHLIGSIEYEGLGNEVRDVKVRQNSQQQAGQDAQEKLYEEFSFAFGL